MKVILTTDVANLGEEGDIVEVANGYARNFLLPRKMVSLYNSQNLSMLETRRAQIEKAKEAKRKAALSEKEKINASSVVIDMPAGENGKLFGSISSVQVVEELAKLGITVERRRVEIPGHTLKHTGEYKVRVKLYGNEEAELRVSVKGHAVTGHSHRAPVAPVAAPVAAEVAQDNAADGEA